MCVGTTKSISSSSMPTASIPDTSSDGMGSVATFAELLKGIGADSTFEACVNDVLNTGHNDLEIQENISKY